MFKLETTEENKAKNQNDANDAAENKQTEGMKERLSEVRKRLRTLEWDKKHNQLNAGMEAKYTELKEECANLEKQLGTQS